METWSRVGLLPQLLVALSFGLMLSILAYALVSRPHNAAAMVLTTAGASSAVIAQQLGFIGFRGWFPFVMALGELLLTLGMCFLRPPREMHGEGSNSSASEVASVVTGSLLLAKLLCGAILAMIGLAALRFYDSPALVDYLPIIGLIPLSAATLMACRRFSTQKFEA